MMPSPAGYFDRAHLTHEFRMLAGLSPVPLRAGRTEFLNHVVDRGSFGIDSGKDGYRRFWRLVARRRAVFLSSCAKYH
jgi:hypothetical protein